MTLNHWLQIFTRTFIWLLAELVFNLYGLDDLADYSEFIFRHRESWHQSSLQAAYVQVVSIPANQHWMGARVASLDYSVRR
jgi:hypothetical protein